MLYHQFLVCGCFITGSLHCSDPPVLLKFLLPAARSTIMGFHLDFCWNCVELLVLLARLVVLIGKMELS